MTNRKTTGGKMTSLVNGDARKIPLAAETGHCIATSPPYWGLRDYGTAAWTGGDPECDHKNITQGSTGQRADRTAVGEKPYGDTCDVCGASRIDAQIGLESDLAAYVAEMVNVGRELWRVLHPSGVWWLNLGDSYNGSGGAGGDYSKGGLKEGQPKYKGRNTSRLKAKDLCGIPWRVALALQADGWWLRSDIIWSKPNPMPSSVTDRPSTSHEYVFLLAKSQKYFYDAEAVKEAAVTKPHAPGNKKIDPGRRDRDRAEAVWAPSGLRNQRSVWTINTQSYRGAHFATWPEKLVEPMVKAGSSEHGVCPECGNPWERVVERESLKRNELDKDHPNYRPGFYVKGKAGDPQMPGPGQAIVNTTTTGWRPTCNHDLDPVPAVVLDPFCGSGTTGIVARRLGRDFVGLDLSYDYLSENARERLSFKALEEYAAGRKVEDVKDLGPLFAGLE